MDTHGTAAVGYDRLPPAGVALSGEPSLYLPPYTVRFGRFMGSGVRVEDDAVVRHSEPEVLTVGTPSMRPSALVGGSGGRRAGACARAQLWAEAAAAIPYPSLVMKLQ